MHDPDQPVHHGSPLDKLPDGLARRVQDELTQHEHLLWVGQPKVELYVGSPGGMTLFFAYFCLLLAVSLLPIPIGVWLFIAIVDANAGKDAVTALFAGGLCSLPFWLFLPMGLVAAFWAYRILVSGPRRLRDNARGTCYALTNRRAITFVAGGRPFLNEDQVQGLMDRRGMTFVVGAPVAMLVRSYSPEQLQDLFRVDLADGVGSLIFLETLVESSGGKVRSVRMHRFGFLCIDDVAKVEDLIRTSLLRVK